MDFSPMVRHTLSGYFTLLRDLNLEFSFYKSLCYLERKKIIIRNAVVAAEKKHSLLFSQRVVMTTNVVLATNVRRRDEGRRRDNSKPTPFCNVNDRRTHFLIYS